MSQSPAVVPSLARAFEPEREALREAIEADGRVSDLVVLAARRALDGAGRRFSEQAEDTQLQKAGLWLLEMVKSGAGVLDNGTDAIVTWDEVAGPKTALWSGRTIFYGAAAVLGLAGFVQGSGLTLIAAGTLAGLRFFDPSNWRAILARLPFTKKTPRLEDNRGRSIEARAHVEVDAQGLINALSDALKTADHILLRLAEPKAETRWRDDPRLMGLVQNLLEAEAAKDGDFALTLVRQELTSVLAGEGVTLVHYSAKTRHLFDSLPAMGEATAREAAPALMAGDIVLRRGTYWTAE